MKKIITLVLTLLVLVGCSTGTPTDKTDKTTEKIDVSTLNILDFNNEQADMSGYELLTDTKHVYKQITMEDSIRLFTEKGSGVVYYGYLGCPFCQQAVPVLNNAARQMGVDIYYVDVMSPEGTSDEITAELIDHIKDYLVEEEGEPVFYVPQVFVIKDGEIVGDHLSLVDSYDISEGDDMNESQRTELRNIYLEMIGKLR
ncbi:MAG: glutaredoxin domain-containing protein [Longicatena sp.]|jgi:predicted bacteriocin transport accessory protein|uniref:TlpA family protein disulfide reductase n=1 Tax=Anaerorhabdus sp. TaxID=1872524 RepID=UPI002FC6A3BC